MAVLRGDLWTGQSTQGLYPRSLSPSWLQMVFLTCQPPAAAALRIGIPAQDLGCCKQSADVARAVLEVGQEPELKALLLRTGLYPLAMQ